MIKIDRSEGKRFNSAFNSKKERIPMIVKEVLNEELLTLAEVKEILSRIAEERREQGIEVGYGFRKALHHADQFSNTSGEKSRELVNKLLKLEKMKPAIAIRIADILPQSRDEVRSIYAKEKYTLGNEELDQILDYVLETMD
jgi:DNA-directed RNA polymerase subunit F